jgi:hypothetical protein
MKCDDVREQVLSVLTGDLDAATVAELESHCADCAACRETSTELRALWMNLATLPPERPSPALRARFYAMLAAERYASETQRHTAQPGALSRWIETWWPRRPALQFALAVAMLLGGIGIGQRLGGGADRNTEIAMLRQEVQSTRNLVTLSLLQTPSPSARLQGVGYSTQIDRPQPELVDALVATLDTDPSVDVRLAAVEALSRFANQDEVRLALVQSLSRQSSPLVQIALIDLMVASRNSLSIEALRHLAGDVASNQTVRQRARWGLDQLL